METDPNRLDEQQLWLLLAGYLGDDGADLVRQSRGEWAGDAYIAAGCLAALGIAVPLPVIDAARAMWADDPLLTDFSERLAAIPVTASSSVA